MLKNRYSDCENIRFVGQVDDLFELAVNPVFNGTGLKIKSFEAMSYGKVLIAHPHSVEGIYDSAKCPIKLATNSDEYIDSIIELINDIPKTKKLSNASLEYISELNGEVERVFLQVVTC